MKTFTALLLAGLCLAAPAVSRATDTIKLTAGTYTGTVTKVSRLEIEVDKSGLSKKIPANEIVMIYFDDEPSFMRTARSYVIGNRYEDALEALEKVDAAEVARPMVRQDLEYYEAYCAARMALGGNGTVKEAGVQMNAFAKANADSFHYFEACEMIGDLLTAMGAYGSAESYYQRLASAPWPDYKMRANVAIGRAQLAQGKTAEAAKAFDAVLAGEAVGDRAQAQRMAARLGKASCLAAVGKTSEAIQAVEEIIANSDPEDSDLQARAYNTLGTAHRKAGRTKEALLAFLHVDRLYASVHEAHAEALANLAVLWTEVHKTERAVAARKVLEESYANSPWAKQGGQ